MYLRLVDGGIPTFEWKLKRVEISHSEKEFEKTSTKKKFEYIEDPNSNLDLYRLILRKLPNKPGCLVLTKVDKNNKMIILDVFKSEFDLREEFKYSKKLFIGEEIDRYSWLKQLSKEKGVREIRFLIGKVA
jgi:hypothetical protein